MTRNVTVYVVTRFASRTNRRNMQFLNLRRLGYKVVLVHQSEGGDYTDASSLPIDQYPRLTGVFGRLGLWRVERLIEKRLFFPSPGILYIKPAQRKLEKEIRGDVDHGRSVCIITALPPHELVLVGLHLKRKFPEVRWIVDWQDLWSYDENYFNKIPESQQERVKALERRALGACDMNVVTNPFAQSILVHHYKVDPQKVRSIYHAYQSDEIDWVVDGGSTKSSTRGPIKIGFLGSLFKPPKVPGRKVLDALDHVRRSGIDLSFHIVGDKYLEKVSRKPVEGLDWVIVHNRIAHEDSLKQVSECDFLLLALEDLPNSEAILHMKLPFYLALRRPILVIVPEYSAVAAVIRDTGTGYVIPSATAWGQGLERVLRTCINDGVQLDRDEEAIACFSWEKVSQEWLEVIRGVSSR